MEQGLTTFEIQYSSIERQCKAWLEVLDGLLAENVVLKNRLAEIIATHQHTRLDLEVLEAFQNSFLLKDAHIMLLRKDVLAQEKFALASGQPDISPLDLSRRQEKLQYDVSMMSEQFGRLRSTFETQFAARA